MPLPEPWSHTHQQWVWNEPYAEDAHGNQKGHFADPVPRKHVAERQLTAQEIISAGYEDRSVVRKVIAVRKPDLYGDLDRVKIDGVSYLVDGPPQSDLKGLFPQYNPLLGGQVFVKRVT